MQWFREHGLALAEEDGGRVFPASGRAADVRNLLLETAGRLRVEVSGDAAVRAVRPAAGGFRLETGAGLIDCGALILATGGRAMAGCEGHELARSLGHAVTPLAPCLTALISPDAWPRGLAGLTLPGARLRAVFGNKTVADERGDLVFTHRGVSGPLAFRVSSRTAFIAFSRNEPLRCLLSAAPDLSEAEIEASLKEFFSSHPRAMAVSALKNLIPKSLAEAALRLAGCGAETLCSEVTREARREMARTAAAMPLSVTARETGGEMVTAGGVSLDEIDQKTMGSRITAGLFFCGEILDIDGFTGGFNLQACWTTGRLAGLGAAAYLEADG